MIMRWPVTSLSAMVLQRQYETTIPSVQGNKKNIASQHRTAKGKPYCTSKLTLFIIDKKNRNNKDT